MTVYAISYNVPNLPPKYSSWVNFHPLMYVFPERSPEYVRMYVCMVLFTKNWTTNRGQTVYIRTVTNWALTAERTACVWVLFVPTTGLWLLPLHLETKFATLHS